MTVTRRMLLALICLALGAVGQVALQAHLGGANAPTYPQLGGTLGELPMTLSHAQTGDHTSDPVSLRAWLGEDLSESATLSAKLPFADDLLLRRYVLEGKSTAVRLYAVYSRRGEDREHHPEICIRDVAGYPEDARAREMLYADKERNRPVQRFRFRAAGEQFINVYYWHYTLEGEFRDGQSYLQALHQRIGLRAPSLTVQITTSALPDEVRVVEQSFLSAVDRAMQRTLLPATARMGCDRLPIRLAGRD